MQAPNIMLFEVVSSRTRQHVQLGGQRLTVRHLNRLEDI